MAISYKKLWKLLIDKDMKKKDLQQLAGVSAASITKLGKNENVNTEIIEKICVALQCWGDKNSPVTRQNLISIRKEIRTHGQSDSQCNREFYMGNC